MLLGGGSNCQGCGCGGTCAACTRTCQNPHTGSAFQEVYRGYSFGAVNGLASDGYLTFSGDEDNPAFIPGGGPFHQAIGGSFYLSSAQTRFPCSLSVSFWRTLFPADATTDTALSSNTVTFTCVSGQFFLPTVGVTLNPGDTYTFSNAVPLVSLFSGDPRSSVGSFGGFATCDNTQMAVQARIDWTSSERVHVLHGIVRECYEYPPNPCASLCGGSGKPSTLYVTLTNLSFSNANYIYGPSGTPPGFPDTYYTPAIISDFQSLLTSAVATSRVMNLCHQWQECLDPSGGLCSPCVGVSYKDSQYGYGGLTGTAGPFLSNLTVYLMSRVNYGFPGPIAGCNEWVVIVFYLGDYDPCAPFDRSGSATGNASISSNNSSYGGIRFDASCDWRITT